MHTSPRSICLQLPISFVACMFFWGVKKMDRHLSSLEDPSRQIVNGISIKRGGGITGITTIRHLTSTRTRNSSSSSLRVTKNIGHFSSYCISQMWSTAYQGLYGSFTNWRNTESQFPFLWNQIGRHREAHSVEKSIIRLNPKITFPSPPPKHCSKSPAHRHPDY